MSLGSETLRIQQVFIELLDGMGFDVVVVRPLTLNLEKKGYRATVDCADVSEHDVLYLYYAIGNVGIMYHESEWDVIPIALRSEYLKDRQRRIDAMFTPKPEEDTI